MQKILNDKGMTLFEVESESLVGAMLANQYLRCAQLAGADLSNIDFRDANLTEANLEGANLTGANLDGANVTNANLASATLDDTSCRGTNFSESQLRGSSFVNATLEDTIFNDIQEGGELNFSQATLKGAEAMHADFSHSNFDSAKIEALYVRSTNLRGADLSLAQTVRLFAIGPDQDRAGTQPWPGYCFYEMCMASMPQGLSPPIFDEQTRWPEDFRFTKRPLNLFGVVKAAATLSVLLWLWLRFLAVGLVPSAEWASAICFVLTTAALGIWHFKEVAETNELLDKEPEIVIGSGFHGTTEGMQSIIGRSGARRRKEFLENRKSYEAYRSERGLRL